LHNKFFKSKIVANLNKNKTNRLNKLITINELSFKYEQGKEVLKNLSLEIPKGERIALLGENGSGKTTLMYIMNGVLIPQKGSLYFKGGQYSYKKKAIKQLRSSIGFLFSNSDVQLFTPSVWEEIAFGLQQTNMSKGEIEQRVETMLSHFQLHDIAQKLPLQLSDGQKKKVILAAIMALEPEMLMCDEPTAFLDWSGTKALIDELNEMHKNGKTILMSTHDTDMAYQWASYIIVLKDGAVYRYGSKKEVMNDRKIYEECGLRKPYALHANEELKSM